MMASSSWLSRVLIVVILTGSSSSFDLPGNERKLKSAAATTLADHRRLPEMCDRFVETGSAPDVATGSAQLALESAAVKNSVETAKRKWGENTMLTWGKRSLTDNDVASIESICLFLLRRESVAAAGERRAGGQQQLQLDRSERRWGDNSMLAWGKRTNSDGDSKGSSDWIRAAGAAEKRGWGENSMSAWGKRDAELSSATTQLTDDESAAVNVKRTWGDQSMGAWGKRSQQQHPAGEHSGEEEEGEEKKNQATVDVHSHRVGFNVDAAPVGGGANGIPRRFLRSSGPRLQYGADRSKQLPVWFGGNGEGPKRNWEVNTMKVWG
jgi:hypothetical protein